MGIAYVFISQNLVGAQRKLYVSHRHEHIFFVVVVKIHKRRIRKNRQVHGRVVARKTVVHRHGYVAWRALVLYHHQIIKANVAQKQVYFSVVVWVERRNGRAAVQYVFGLVGVLGAERGAAWA